MIDKEEAWNLIRVMPNYYHDTDENPNAHWIIMNDIWGWACADCIIITDENVQRIASLYDKYGFCGLLYYCVENEGYNYSEFTDNNRMIQFVQNEERIKKEVPDYNKRGHAKRKYIIDGEIKANNTKGLILLVKQCIKNILK